MIRFFQASFLILCLVFVACSSETAPSSQQVVSEIKELPVYSSDIAKVGEYFIKEDFLRFRIKLELDKFPKDYIKKSIEKPIQKGSQLYPILKNVLDRLVEDHLILAYGLKMQKQIPLKELDDRIARKKKFLGAKGLEAILNEKNIPYRRWKELAELEIRVQYILDQVIGNDLKVSVQEIRSHYTKNRKNFEVGEMVRARHFVTDSREKAEEIYKRLKNGENFAKLAVNHSQSPDRAKGGDLGYFEKGNFPKAFDEVCFGLEKGEISSIIKTPYGYHIFKLIDKKPAGLRPLTAVSAKIHRSLFEAKLKERYASLLQEIRQEIKVEVFEKNLKDFVL